MITRDPRQTQDLVPLKTLGKSSDQSEEKVAQDNDRVGQQEVRGPRSTDRGRFLDTCSEVRSLSETHPDEFFFLDPAQHAGELGGLGQYRVLKLLGKGGMGLVFLAEDPRLQRRVALKVMQPHQAENFTARQRFLREARATANIHSDHIITVHEIGQVNDLPYLAAEFLEGQTLDAWLEKQPRPPMEQVLGFALQIACGLEAAHKAGVIHRDIKSSNIWVEPSGRIKILDFGLARSLEADPSLTGLTQAGMVLGTPAYMAPEQAEGKPVDARCDLFSLGCVLYEMAAGVKPFDGPTTIAILKATALVEPTPLHRLNPVVPRACSNLVMRLMAKNPQQRPESATEVVQILKAVLAESAGEAPPGRSAAGRGVVAKGWQSARQQGRLVLEAVLACLLIVYVFDTKGSTPRPRSNSLAASEDFAKARLVSDELLLGMSAPFSGSARELGRAMDVGMRTYFNHVNDEGGIAGRKLKLVALDDGNLPERALANMKEFQERRKVFAVIGNVGTHTAEQTMPYARAKKMIFFGAFTGAALLRKEPPDRYVFNYRASCGEETAALVKYLREGKALQPEQIAVFAQQDSYGDAGFRGVVKMLGSYGRQPESIVRVGHARGSDDVGDAVAEILRHKEIRAVIMVSTYRPAAQFIRRLKDAKADLFFANVSDVGADALAEELRHMHADYADRVIVTQVVPHPASECSVVLKYNELLHKYFPHETPTFASLEGYLNAVVFTEGLRRAGNKLTTETLVEALETIRDLDLGLGATLQYGPSEHQASHKVWYTVLDRMGTYQILDLE